ncbi:hypothetical protein AGMMS49959_05970 [Planctomycetales bacterium]|nr:hypothetical protein AGMMS49959_05970 [Planctomycetales bacterium]
MKILRWSGALLAAGFPLFAVGCWQAESNTNPFDAALTDDVPDTLKKGPRRDLLAQAAAADNDLATPLEQQLRALRETALKQRQELAKTRGSAEELARRNDELESSLQLTEQRIKKVQRVMRMIGENLDDGDDLPAGALLAYQGGDSLYPANEVAVPRAPRAKKSANFANNDDWTKPADGLGEWGKPAAETEPEIPLPEPVVKKEAKGGDPWDNIALPSIRPRGDTPPLKKTPPTGDEVWNNFSRPSLLRPSVAPSTSAASDLPASAAPAGNDRWQNFSENEVESGLTAKRSAAIILPPENSAADSGRADNGRKNTRSDEWAINAVPPPAQLREAPRESTWKTGIEEPELDNAWEMSAAVKKQVDARVILCDGDGKEATYIISRRVGDDMVEGAIYQADANNILVVTEVYATNAKAKLHPRYARGGIDADTPLAKLARLPK